MAYGFDNISILKDGKRIFPVMGEIHYSRVPRAEWKERLYKMKAGGVTIVSGYVIWIHHEEIEGQYDWSGERDLKAFVKAVSECGMKMLLRIGPWCHGEVRNGGFPDWLLHKDFDPRTNDEKYFAVVKKWYEKIYEQVKDFICNPADDSTKDNPVIGVQIENEFGHCGGIYVKDAGEKHMMRLQKIARECGFNVALYTATGWGGAWTGGMLPVMGGYCDAPWDQRTTEIEPSGNYTFTHERNDHNIGSDHGFGYGITFDLKKFPYLTAELGGGLQVTAHRRTIALAEDIAAVALTKLGSGCNLLGYYMYSGGTNPEGKLTTLQESTATGYLNNLPVKSYDFRAPLREFGQVSDTLRELKLLSYFVREWGEGFCSLDCEIPSEIKPDDLNSLRLAYRTDGKRGYAFINNYVRHQKMAEHKDVEIKSPDKNTVFPMINVGDGDYFFLPFNMNYGKTLVKTATVTPLTKISGGDGDVFVFYRRKNDSSDKGFFDFSERHGEKFLVLSRSDALNSWRDESGRLIITGSDSCAVENEKGEIEIHTRSDGKIFVFPDFDKVPSGWKKTGLVDKNTACDLDEILFAEYEPLSASEQRKEEKISFEKIREENGCAYYSLDFSSLSDNAFVRLSYTGDSANLYKIKNGERKLLLDHFYLGEDYPWEIGLKRFADGKADLKNLELEILPLKKGAKLYLEKWPEFSGDESAVLHSVSCETERRFRI